MAPQATTNGVADAPTAAAPPSSSPAPLDGSSLSSSAPSAYGVFLPRVASLPLINSALGVAKSYYDVTKNRYEVVGKLEQELNNLGPRVLEVTPQVATVAVSKGLHVVDHFALTGLEVLERHVPLITQPTPTVLDSGKRFVDQTFVAPVSSAITRVRNISREDVARVVAATRELIQYLIATAEGYISAIRQGVISILQRDDAKLQKLLDGYVAQLQAALKAALDQVDQLTPPNVKQALGTVAKTSTVVLETTRSVLETVYHSLAKFSAQVTVVYKNVVDPILKKALEAWLASFSLFLSYSQLAINTVFGSKLIRGAAEEKAEPVAEKAQ